jgi:hypothetical protein
MGIREFTIQFRRRYNAYIAATTVIEPTMRRFWKVWGSRPPRSS